MLFPTVRFSIAKLFQVHFMYKNTVEISKEKMDMEFGKTAVL